MKNVIPLVVAVVLGLAAVYLVSRILVTNQDAEKEPQVSVVIAARNLEPGDELNPGSCSFKTIPRSAMPKSVMLWENVGLVYGQKIPYKIPAGDYIQLSDLQLNVSLADCVEKGKWLIPVTFSDAALVKMLMPEDEIAIVATYSDTRTAVPNQENIPVSDEVKSAAAQLSQKRETVVLFPRVKVTGLANEKGMFREPGGSTATIFVSLPPRQATILLAAQREAELYPVLRRRNDTTALNRRELGTVNGRTFDRIRSNLETAELPDVTSLNQ